MHHPTPSHAAPPFGLRQPLKAGSVTRARELLRLTQAELARLLRVDRVTVARWETGVRAPDVAVMNRLLELVTRLLLVSLRRPVADAKRPLPAHVRRLLSPRRLRPQMRRLAHVLLSGGAGLMSPDEWCRLLWLAPAILQGTPQTQGLVDGGDVGLAILRALMGQEYAGRIGEADPAELQVLGELRVLHEVEFAAAMLELAVGRIVAGAVERRAEDRKTPAIHGRYADAAPEVGEAGRARLVAEAPAVPPVDKRTSRHKTRHPRSTA